MRWYLHFSPGRLDPMGYNLESACRPWRSAPDGRTDTRRRGSSTSPPGGLLPMGRSSRVLMLFGPYRIKTALSSPPWKIIQPSETVRFPPRFSTHPNNHSTIASFFGVPGDSRADCRPPAPGFSLHGPVVARLHPTASLGRSGAMRPWP